MNVSVVICAYSMERWDSLVAAAQSCNGQTLKAHEVIVVIDHNDELFARASRELLDVVVTANDSVKGLSGARNSGVAICTGDVIVFLDDDAYAEPEWLENLVRPLEDQMVAGVGGWIVPHWPGEPPAWFPETFYWVLGCSYAGLPEDRSRIRNPIGSNMAIRRRVFTRVGGFVSGLGRIRDTPLGGEETEVCIRYTSQYPDEFFVLARDAIVHHRVPDSRLRLRYFLARCWSEGLSKAAIASLVGVDTGLAAERVHLMRSLPREVGRSLRLAARQPRAGSARLALMALGSVCAIAGYSWGRGQIRQPLETRPSAIDDPMRATSHRWHPIEILEIPVEVLSEGVPIRVSPGERVWIEVKRQGQIVGVLETRSETGELLGPTLREAAAAFADVVPSALGDVPDELLARASVVVPTICENPGELVSVIDGILELDYPDFEVIVVDNRPLENKSPLPKLRDDARLTIVDEPRPGVSAARNRGLAVATGEFIAFTDDDVVVDRQWLRALGARFALDSSIDAIGGLVLPVELETQPQLWFEEFYGGFSQSFQSAIVRLDNHDPSDELFPYNAGRFGSGCNMALRRSAVVRWGGFDTLLGVGTPSVGGEDLGMFLKLLLDGATLAFEPAALVRHHHRRTQHEFLRQVLGYGVGLGALYSAMVVRDPRHVRAMGKRLPAAIRLLLRPREQRSVSSAPSYPRRTLFLQLLGLAYGPVAYVHSVVKSRRAHG